MLKRNDLAKQFELVVQQEIKNYNDSLNGILDSIRNLKIEIKEVSKNNLENYGAIHSAQTNLSIELENIKDFLKILAEKFDRHFNDQTVVNERNALEMRDIKGAFHSKKIIDDNVNSKIKALSDQIYSVEALVEGNHRVTNDNLDDIMRRFRQEILKAKKDILDAPTEAALVRKELEEKIVSHTVDVAGIMRELRLFKHDNMVAEKKIENIYTLIGRLQMQGEK